MRSVHTWFQQEIYASFKSRWHWMQQHLILVCIVSFLLHIFIFIFAPQVWIPSTLKSIELREPTAVIHKGRLSQIVLSTQEYPKQKWLINCADQHADIELLCDSSHHKQQLAISMLKLKYYQQNALPALKTKQAAFVIQLVLKNEQLAQSPKQQHEYKAAFEQWNTHAVSPIKLLRCFICLHFFILILLICTKIKIKNQKKT